VAFLKLCEEILYTVTDKPIYLILHQLTLLINVEKTKKIKI